jgi:pilus assembly protein TadC
MKFQLFNFKKNKNIEPQTENPVKPETKPKVEPESISVKKQPANSPASLISAVVSTDEKPKLEKINPTTKKENEKKKKELKKKEAINDLNKHAENATTITSNKEIKSTKPTPVDAHNSDVESLTKIEVKATGPFKSIKTYFNSKKAKSNSPQGKKIHTDIKISQATVDANRRYYKKKKKEKRRVSRIFDEALEKSGYEIRGDEYKKKLKRTSVFIAIIASLVLSIGFGLVSQQLHYFIIFLLLSFISFAALFYILGLIGSFIFLDYAIYRRTKEIEEVLPEFLQLASANISAGMPIDRALWFAVRPKFGVLAKEIEEVAKGTMAGEDLEEALEKFTKKYDSKVLKESMNLLIEGMRAGGEIGFLLNQIASNMQDIKIMRKEIAASVMSYVIFITAASIIGAPFLLALSAQLLVIMSGISSSMEFEDTGGSSTNTFKIDMSSDSISIHDFRIFAVVVLLFSSIFSAMIISVIRKGNTNESIKIIPGYIFVSLLIFFAASALFGGLMGSFF